MIINNNNKLLQDSLSGSLLVNVISRFIDLLPKYNIVTAYINFFINSGKEFNIWNDNP